MTVSLSRSGATGLAGPVVVSATAILLGLSPLMRGGNRYAALIPLEFISLFILVASCWGLLLRPQPGSPGKPLFRYCAWLLMAAPFLIGVLQLTPLPPEAWASLTGRAIYLDDPTFVQRWRPLTLTPHETTASLLAALPLLAAFLVGSLAGTRQLRWLFGVLAAMAFAQSLFALLQAADGQFSPLYFGLLTFGTPIGSFANRNHLANYLAMVLVAYLWLAYDASRDRAAARSRRLSTTQFNAVWAAGGALIVLALLLSRSRGAMLFGLPAAGIGLMLVSRRDDDWLSGWRVALGLAAGAIAVSVLLIGFDAATSRLTGEQLASSAGFRGLLAKASFEGAAAFWPWGAGWGSYPWVFPRFQPAEVAGFANHAHQDYAEMLFEGGLAFAALALACAAILLTRTLQLVRRAMRDRKLNRLDMASALCGLGLLGFLLHSLVEFNMRIPANAIVAALFAGVFLRSPRVESENTPASRPSTNVDPPHPASIRPVA